jgi:hypothetical protein
MKIAATIIGTDDKSFRRVAANSERIALAKRIATATRNKADLVLLPAGFPRLVTPTRSKTMRANWLRSSRTAGYSLVSISNEAHAISLGGMPARAAPQTTPARAP